MKFGERLQHERQTRDLTQKSVATAINVSRQTISSWETGNSYPDIGSLIQLSDYYAISLDTLLKEDNGMKDYLKKQDVLTRLLPLLQAATVIDILFLIFVIFTPIHGMVSIIVYAMGIVNVVVISKIKTFIDQVSKHPRILTWPHRRWWAILINVAITLGCIISFYLNNLSELTWNLVLTTICFWTIIIYAELTYRRTLNQ